jgi:hypothetical protein
MMLLLLPPVQALGTGNTDLYVLAVNQFVCWVALMVLAVLTLPRGSWTRTLAGTATAVAVVVAATVGIQGLLVQPYRTDGFAASTATVGGSGPLAGLRVAPSEAAMFRDLRAATGTSPTTGRPVFAFDEMPGLVLALNGTSVGEPWYSAIDQTRTAAGIRSACARGPIAAAHAVVLFSRAPRAVDEGALASCGLVLHGRGADVPLFGVDGRVSVYRAVTAHEEGP